MRSKIKWIIASECTMLAMIGVVQAKGWRGLAPLHSTRADVERLLGAPKESTGVASTYDTRDERVVVFYSDGKCKEGASDDWNVPRDTLVKLTVHPNAELLIDTLKLNKTEYERQLDYHAQGTVYYINRMEGIFISARTLSGKGEDVDNITYGPTAEDNHLKCSATSTQPTGGNEKEFFIRKFDEYSNIPFSDEKARLDNFAIYLQKNEPTFKGYIIAYAGPHMRSRDARARAKRAQDYLVKVRGIEAARIVIMDGGRRHRLEVELHALPSSMSPTPTPYRN